MTYFKEKSNIKVPLISAEITLLTLLLRPLVICPQAGAGGTSLLFCAGQPWAACGVCCRGRSPRAGGHVLLPAVTICMSNVWDSRLDKSSLDREGGKQALLNRSMLRNILNNVNNLCKSTLLNRKVLPVSQMNTRRVQRMVNLAVLLHSEGGVSTSVGVIDHGIEGLVNPLPEEHGRCGPKTERSIIYRPSPVT